MTKNYSEIVDFIAFTLFVTILLIYSETGHAAPSSLNSVDSVAALTVESKSEIVELSAWPRIRDSILGRQRNPPPPPPPPPHHVYELPPPPPRPGRVYPLPPRQPHNDRHQPHNPPPRPRHR